MDVRKKLVRLLDEVACKADSEQCQKCVKQDCVRCAYENVANHLIAHGVTVQEWISVDERIPQNFVSVLGYMTDAGEFPPVRECYTVGNAFFFPALGDVHPVSHWCELPQPPKGE